MDLPPDYGKWYAVHKRFLRWAQNGKWERLAKVLSQNAELKNVVVMIDSSHIKVRMRATWTKGDNQNIGCAKEDSIPKSTYIVIDSKERVINLKTTTGTTADCSVALDLIKKN